MSPGKIPTNIRLLNSSIQTYMKWSTMFWVLGKMSPLATRAKSHGWFPWWVNHWLELHACFWACGHLKIKVQSERDLLHFFLFSRKYCKIFLPMISKLGKFTLMKGSEHDQKWSDYSMMDKAQQEMVGWHRCKQKMAWSSYTT